MAAEGKAIDALSQFKLNTVLGPLGASVNFSQSNMLMLVGAGLTLRSSFTFTPKMTLQLYAQLFFADVRYRALYESRGEGGPRYVTLAMLENSASSPSAYDQRDVSLNVNAVFRWEFLPGSVLYLVYTRGQGGTPAWADPEAPRPRLDFAALGRVPVENVFMLKASYYFAR